jgi:hypothetical protein
MSIANVIIETSRSSMELLERQKLAAQRAGISK